MWDVLQIWERRETVEETPASNVRTCIETRMKKTRREECIPVDIKMK